MPVEEEKKEEKKDGKKAEKKEGENMETEDAAENGVSSFKTLFCYLETTNPSIGICECHHFSLHTLSFGPKILQMV